MIFESIQYILDIAFILVPHDNMSVDDFFFSRSDKYTHSVAVVFLIYSVFHLIICTGNKWMCVQMTFMLVRIADK